MEHGVSQHYLNTTSVREKEREVVHHCGLGTLAWHLYYAITCYLSITVWRRLPKKLHIGPQSVLSLCYKPQALGFSLSHNWCLLLGHLGLYFLLSRGLLLLSGIKVPLIERSLATKLNSPCFTSKCVLNSFILEHFNKKYTWLQNCFNYNHHHHFHCRQRIRHIAYSTLLQSWKTLLFNHIHISRPSVRSFSSRKPSIITATLRNIFLG